MISAPWYIKLAGVGSFCSMVLAQEMPSDWNWAKYPIDALCLGVLFWIMTRTFPGLLATFAQQLKDQQEVYQKTIDTVMNQHKDSMQNMTTAFSSKIEAQTLAIATAIKEVKNGS